MTPNRSHWARPGCQPRRNPGLAAPKRRRRRVPESLCTGRESRNVILHPQGPPFRASGSRLPRKPQSGAAAGRRAWRVGRGAVRAAAGDRRRRLRQDQHAGPSRRPSDRQRRRSPPHPADDVFAPRRRRDDEAGRADRAQGPRRQRRRHDRRAGLGRHLPRHRRAAAARICRPDRARSRLHDPRPRGFRRPDEPGPARARLLENRKPLSDQGHLPCDLFALRQRGDAARAGAGRVVSLVRRLGRRS